MDAVGEWNSATVSVGRADHRIDKIYEVNFPHSIGLLYSALTAFLGFEVNEGEYKVMGLAAYGRPTRLAECRRLIRLLPRGRFEIDLKYFSWQESDQRLYSDELMRLLGVPGTPEAACYRIDQARESGRGDGLERSASGQRSADIAASLQEVVEEAIRHVVRYAQEVTGTRSAWRAAWP